MKQDILGLIEKNSKITIPEISVMLGKDEEKIALAIKEMEEEGIICGYSTLINWDKTDRQYVSAMVEVKVTPQPEKGYNKMAERIYGFDEVRSIFLMSGVFDFLIMVEGKDIKQISYFISNKLGPIDGIISISTHFVLKKYKDHGVIIEKHNSGDERMLVSP